MVADCRFSPFCVEALLGKSGGGGRVALEGRDSCVSELGGTAPGYLRQGPGALLSGRWQGNFGCKQGVKVVRRFWWI